MVAVGGDFEGVGLVKLMNPASGTPKMNLKPKQSVSDEIPDAIIGAVTSLAFSPEGATLATGHGHSNDTGDTQTVIRLWDLKTGEEKATFAGHRNAVLSVAFSPYR